VGELVTYENETIVITPENVDLIGIRVRMLLPVEVFTQLHDSTIPITEVLAKLTSTSTQFHEQGPMDDTDSVLLKPHRTLQ
jgi:hypothetical protein